MLCLCFCVVLHLFALPAWMSWIHLVCCYCCAYASYSRTWCVQGLAWLWPWTPKPCVHGYMHVWSTDGWGISEHVDQGLPFSLSSFVPACLNLNVSLLLPGICVAVPLLAVLSSKAWLFQGSPVCCHESPSLVHKNYVCVMDGVHALLRVCLTSSGLSVKHHQPLWAHDLTTFLLWCSSSSSGRSCWRNAW